MSSIAEAFADGPAFVPYLAAGDPDYESSLTYVEALERGGADVIELGLPFSEPIAEGPTIQSAIVRALEAGMTPTRYFEFVADLDVDVPLVCMTYYNLIAQFGDDGERGPEAFVRRAAETGIDGFVVPDLPAEEAGPLREACDEYGCELVFIIAPTTRGERLERIMSQVSGYVYVQARLGTTGARTALSDRTAESLERITDWDVPKAVGFGISTGDHAQRVIEAGADGVIVGSALVDIVAQGVERGDPAVTVADRLEGKARELTEGALRGMPAADGGPHPERT
ncbi:tryptophan synthase subunit alpha [Haloplanus sp.]|uniref:tryptophan synthase subunit alpha n=1 Tax=Haloplanus sp. TaxID=1961696 RepID=UPI002622D711|nr:tryptophan synthase subunit alpha [Haloplanus sp.]